MPASSLPPKKFIVNKIVLDKEQALLIKKSLQKHNIKAANEEKLDKERVDKEKVEEAQEKVDEPVEGKPLIYTSNTSIHLLLYIHAKFMHHLHLLCVC